MSNRNMIALKNAMIVILFLITFLLSRSVFALEIKYSNVDPISGEQWQMSFLTLRGEIRSGDYNYLLDVLLKEPYPFLTNRVLVLSTPGGDVEEAMKIARLVKGVYGHVEVGEAAGKCASAGFLIFASAAIRIAESRTVGIHRLYVDPRRLSSLSPSQAVALQNDVFRRARSYLQELQIPTSLIDTMFQRASSEVYWLSRAELENQIGHYAPWYEEFLIAKCGLDKAVTKEYFNTANPSLLNRLMEFERCGDKLTSKEAEGFLVSEFQKAGKYNRGVDQFRKEQEELLDKSIEEFNRREGLK